MTSLLLLQGERTHNKKSLMLVCLVSALLSEHLPELNMHSLREKVLDALRTITKHCAQNILFLLNLVLF